MSMMKEFKEFAVKGNVVDMAVGIVIGAAFGKIVKSFVADIVMPPIGLAIGGVDFTQLKIVLKEAVGEEAIYIPVNLKPLAKKYFEAVNKYDQDLVSQLTTTEYIQHNPNVESGQKAFLDLLPILKSHNAKIINQRIIQDGQFIIMHHKWVNAKPMGGDELSAFHIIRFNSENKIAEHWNVASTSLDFEGPLQTNESGVTLKNKSLVSSLYKDKKVHRIFGEENFILVIFEDEGFAKYELHFVENQRSTRSWKIHQKIPTENLKNQNTMFNFPTSD